MTQLPIADLTERVNLLLAASELRDVVTGVVVEPVESTDDEVLRVTIKVSRPRSVKAETALQVLRTIHDDLSQVDDRFPSVRFAEAA